MIFRVFVQFLKSDVYIVVRNNEIKSYTGRRKSHTVTRMRTKWENISFRIFYNVYTFLYLHITTHYIVYE